MACRIHIACRAIITISKHIIAEDTLAGGDKGVGVDESAEFGIVVTALEVIQLSFGDTLLAVLAKIQLPKHNLHLILVYSKDWKMQLFIARMNEMPYPEHECFLYIFVDWCLLKFASISVIGMVLPRRSSGARKR